MLGRVAGRREGRDVQDFTVVSDIFSLEFVEGNSNFLFSKLVSSILDHFFDGAEDAP